MGGQEDFVASLEAIVAIRREEPRELPGPEELLAYRDGRLDEAGRRAIEEKIAVHPDVAHALADLAAFPDVRPAPGAPEVSDEEVDRHWQSFRWRLAGVQQRPEARYGAEKTSATAGLPLAVAAAVCLVVGSVAGFFVGRAARETRPEAAINVTIAELAPVEEGRVRSAGPVAVEVAGSSEALVLVLGLEEPLDEREFSDFKAEIIDSDGSQVWSRAGLRPTPLGNFHLSFRRGALKPGAYRIHLFGRTEREETQLAAYQLRLLEKLEAP